ncbi:MAG: NAD(P)/FAD-dependent oxidoreductase [Anaeroplasmataceae bacterium]
MKIAIVGCGAGALLLSSKLKNANITIFERNKKIGSKLLASGNGKCNLLNINATCDNYNNKEFVSKLITSYPPRVVLNEFHKLGLITKIDDEGRVYPHSESSQAVLNILLDNIKAKIITDYTVKSITKVNGKYKINDYNELFDYLVLDTGSKASLKEEYQNIPYDYLSSLNIGVTKLYPSLVGFKTNMNIASLSGLRCKTNVKLYVDNMLIHEEKGEVIFKNDGLSGIVIMNMSSYYQNTNKRNAYITLDLLYPYNESDILNIKGAIHPLLYNYYLKNNMKLRDLKEFKINITDTYDFLNAQVVSGGVKLSLINDDLRLVSDDHIFLMGEMLDINGVCGGYNLLFAFMCALKIYDCLEGK